MLRKLHLRISILRKITALLLAGLFLLFSGCFDDDEVDFDAQLKADLALIDEYLASRNIVALKDPQERIRYVLHVEGEGRSPHDTTCVRATYQGKILDTDQVFISATNQSFPMAGALIEGWKIALPLLHVGDQATIYIPSILAYGPTGIPNEGIEPNKNVVFNFSLEYVGKTYSSSPSPTGSCN